MVQKLTLCLHLITKRRLGLCMPNMLYSTNRGPIIVLINIKFLSLYSHMQSHRRNVECVHENEYKCDIHQSPVDLI